MPSWRDSASEQVQADLDGLLHASLPFAQQLLEEHGDFLPYGVAVSTAGQLRMVAADVGQRVRPSSVELLSMLVDGLRRRREAIRAVALVFRVRLVASEAVRVELEHRDGPAIAVLVPYRTRRLRRAIQYGDLTSAPGTHRLWTR